MTEFKLQTSGRILSTEDNLHCLHACVRMVMAANPGGKIFSFEELDQILGTKPGFYSWEFELFPVLEQEGFDIKMVSNFSISDFVQRGASYLLEYYGEEAGRVLIEHCDFDTAVESARKLLDNPRVAIDQRIPSMDEISANIREGWYFLPTLNACVLNSEPGYEGHKVFVYGFNDEGVFYHDPGLEAAQAHPKEERYTSWAQFEEACSYPSKATRKFSFYRPKDSHRAIL